MVTRPKDKESTIHPVLIPKVSECLRKGRDGKSRLLKSRMVSSPTHGREEVGGYRVVSGVSKSTVAVLWVPADSLAEDQIESERRRMLALYAKLLRESGFRVRRESYGLSVDTKTEEQREEA